MARQHGHPPVTFLGKGGSWIQNTLAPPCGSRWRCHGRVRLVLLFFLLIPFLFKQWWSGSGGPGRSQRVTTPHCSCGTTQTSRAWGAPPTDSVLEPELDTPQSQVKGGWLLLVCHFLDALQTSCFFADIQTSLSSDSSWNQYSFETRPYGISPFDCSLHNRCGLLPKIANRQDLRVLVLGGF